MVVYKFYVVRLTIFPGKTYPPLLIDADAVLVLPVALQLFELVSGRYTQKVQCCSGIELLKPPEGPGFGICRQDPAFASPPELFRMFICKTDYHFNSNGKRYACQGLRWEGKKAR